MERTYTIPLRKGTMKTARTRRAKKAVLTLRAYLMKHMKATDIKLTNALNELIWQHGMRNPLLKVTVIATKDDKGVVKARLVDEPTQKEPAKKEAKPVESKKTSKDTVVQAQVVEEKKETPVATKQPETEKPTKQKREPKKA